ncbi:ATPase family associated with various cellular activities (AAA) [Fibrobacter sp. UWB16]|uniref:AAA family ATPase n=1 Tax=Fibrobacter sp. UWB16 TaxID=1945874 RepID=UPI000BD3266B|nr:AAA family ATPase [Fibrobacter sp. UWB16]SOD17315.1 ATPase family associated with various cellular activities (AAA) [Fibrobacter sp. UWB16]
MKKKNVINLIRYYAEKNDPAFREEAYEIARDFDASGDFQLSEYIMALMSSANAFVPQMHEDQMTFFRKIAPSHDSLPLPTPIEKDVIGIINAIQRNMGINKFLFQGAPGTGKTESVRQIARILERDLFCVNFDTIIDSKLGQTQKNIVTLFDKINHFTCPENTIVLFEKMDIMGQVQPAMLKGLDNLKEQITIIATTNHFKHFDKALSHRFDLIVDFNRYTQEDLQEIAESILNNFLDDLKIAGRNPRLFRKILGLNKKLPSPADLRKIIKADVTFSEATIECDYLKNIYKSFVGSAPDDLHKLQTQGFTVREIEILSGISKSQVSRILNGDGQTKNAFKEHQKCHSLNATNLLFHKPKKKINLAEVYRKAEEEIVWR